MSKRMNPSRQNSPPVDPVAEQKLEGAALSEKQPPLNPLDHAIVIDPEFEHLLPPLTDDESAGLEQRLLAEGCRDPLVLWKGFNILLEGHHRLRLCRKHRISYTIVEIDLPDRTAALDWIIHKQLSQRNLPPEAVRYFRGKRYNAEKQGHGGQRTADEASGQTDHLKTDERLAEVDQVSPKTIRRAGEYAEAVDTLAANCGTEAKAALLGGGLKVSQQEVLQLAKESPAEQRKALQERTAAGSTKPRKAPAGKGTIQVPKDPEALAQALVQKLGQRQAVQVHQALARVLKEQGAEEGKDPEAEAE